MPAWPRRFSPFGRSAATLVSGNVAAQALPVLAAPLLTRLYAPEDFGLFALYASLFGILQVGATLRYETAIMLPDGNDDAAVITRLSLLLSIAAGTLVLGAVVIAAEPLARRMGNPALAPWLYVLPASVVLLGWVQAFTAWGNRRRAYRRLSAGRVTQTGVMTAMQVALGAMGAGGGGLIGGVVAGQAAAAAVLGTGGREWMTAGTGRMMTLARRYRDFPRFALPGALLNATAFNLLYVLLSVLFSGSEVGYYALIYRVLALPSSVIGNAVGLVYFERAAAERRDSGTLRSTFHATLKRLVVIGIPVFAVLLVGVRYLFAPVFGAEWAEAARFAIVLLPFFLVRFISSTLSTTMTVCEKLKPALAIHATIITANLVLFAAAWVSGMGFFDFLLAYAVIQSLLYGAFLLYYRRLAILPVDTSGDGT